MRRARAGIDRHWMVRAGASATAGIPAHQRKLKAPPGMDSPPPPPSPPKKTAFAGRVEHLLERTAAANEPQAAAKAARAEETQKAAMASRRETLVFDDVGDGLDLFNWRRDTLGYIGGMFAPLEFMLNYYLKWELRYMTHDANKELANADGKLFDAASALHPAGVPFPVVGRLWCMGAYGNSDGAPLAEGREKGRVYFVDGAQFKRPTLVLLSPLGFDSARCADDEWLSLLHNGTHTGWRPPEPTRAAKSVLRYTGLEIGPTDAAAKAPAPGNQKRSFAQAGAAAGSGHKHLSVLRLRTWAIRGTETLGAWSTARMAKQFPKAVMDNTYCGVHLERSFLHTALGLRNWQTTYALLVDHNGNVRWVATGSPSPSEAAAFHSLVKQLEREFVAIGGTAAPRFTADPVGTAKDGGAAAELAFRESMKRSKNAVPEGEDAAPKRRSIFSRLFRRVVDRSRQAK